LATIALLANKKATGRTNMQKTLALTLMVIASTLALSACADTWVKPGATEQEFEATKTECMSRAAARFPPINRPVQIGNGYTTPVTTNCNGFGYSGNCISTGGQYVPPSIINIDDNQNGRQEDIRSCFFEKGWHLKDGSDTGPTPSAAAYANNPQRPKALR
jgi:hypothetical protein